MFKRYKDYLLMILVNYKLIKIYLICNNIKFLLEMNLKRLFFFLNLIGRILKLILIKMLILFKMDFWVVIVYFFNEVLSDFGCGLFGVVFDIGVMG